MIHIPQPKAVPKDKVWAENYRTADHRMENGEVLNAEYHMDWSGVGGRWSYRVRLERRTKSNIQYGREYGNNTLILHVSDDGIEKMTKEEIEDE